MTPHLALHAESGRSFIESVTEGPAPEADAFCGGGLEMLT